MAARSSASLALALLVALLSLSASSAYVSQYLVNGGFETGDQTGWSASYPSAVSIWTGAHHGNFCNSLGQVTMANTISQLSDLTPVTLSQAVNVVGNATYGYTLQWSQLAPKSYGLQLFTVGYSVDGGSLTTITTPNAVLIPDDVTAYNTFNASLPAVGLGVHSVSVQFTGQSAYGSFFVDDVVLSDAHP